MNFNYLCKIMQVPKKISNFYLFSFLIKWQKLSHLVKKVFLEGFSHSQNKLLIAKTSRWPISNRVSWLVDKVVLTWGRNSLISCLWANWIKYWKDNGITDVKQSFLSLFFEGFLLSPFWCFWFNSIQQNLNLKNDFIKKIWSKH